MNQKLIFRCSGLGKIMSEPIGKSNKEKYDEAIADRNRWQNDYSLIVNKDTKTAKKKLEQIQRKNTEILKLEQIKNEILLSKDCINQILKTYASQVHKRREQIRSKFLSKGNAREEDSITLLSVDDAKMYVKNSERLTNEYITGEIDVFVGDEIRKAKETIDTKSSWSYNTYLSATQAETNPDYEWQGHGYMWLSGAEQHTIAYCLVNGTKQAINDEIRALGWSMGVLDASVETDPKFLEQAMQIEINHIFDINSFCLENPDYEFFNKISLSKGKFYWDFDIPREKRIHKRVIKRSDEHIKRLKERINECREFANQRLFKNNL